MGAGQYRPAGSDPAPPFARTLLRKGAILDVLDPRVAQYPAGAFRWPERDVTPEDIERMEQLERHNS